MAWPSYNLVRVLQICNSTNEVLSPQDLIDSDFSIDMLADPPLGEKDFPISQKFLFYINPIYSLRSVLLFYDIAVSAFFLDCYTKYFYLVWRRVCVEGGSVQKPPRSPRRWISVSASRKSAGGATEAVPATNKQTKTSRNWVVRSGEMEFVVQRTRSGHCLQLLLVSCQPAHRWFQRWYQPAKAVPIALP